MTVTDHGLTQTKFQNHIIIVHRLDENDSDHVLQFVADVLPVVGSDILFQLFPRSTHLICCILLTIIKQSGANIGTNTFPCCIGRASVILASSSTASSTATSIASTTTAVPSTARLDKISGVISILLLTNSVGDDT
jgi:hypothetical protein